ncbi:MAG TPA: nicotinate-nucleotide adenylyltransferase [Candidatus Eisenbacteria bacterium]|nr:nicotinate-nucleotide adenylyltransferase [Candidatus Eisenbacteria bacterium]
MRRAERLGVFGGTFDPVHVGHLIMAEEALAKLGLDRMLFVPAARPAHKRSRTIASAAHRVQMLRLSVRGVPRFEVSTLEVDRGGVSFTVDTLEHLTRKARDLYFVMGQDSLEDFPTWRDPERIARLARLAVVPRGDGRFPRIRPALRGRVSLLDPPRIGISSSEIRRRLKRGLSVRWWMPDSALRYAIENGLYGIRRQ